MPESDLVKITGFGKDGNAAKAQARALLKEAGVQTAFRSHTRTVISRHPMSRSAYS